MHEGQVPQGGPSSEMAGSQKSRMSNLTQLSGSWAAVKWYRQGIGQATCAGGVLKIGTEMIFHPRPHILIFEGTERKVPSLCQLLLIVGALGSFGLKRIPRPQPGSEGKCVTIDYQCLHEYKRGCLWLVCLEIYTAAFRTEVCYNLCQRQSMFL